MPRICAFELREAFHVVHYASVLVGADGAPVERIENNDDFLAAIIGELDLFLILVLQREIRRGRPT